MGLLHAPWRWGRVSHLVVVLPNFALGEPRVNSEGGKEGKGKRSCLLPVAGSSGRSRARSRLSEWYDGANLISVLNLQSKLLRLAESVALFVIFTRSSSKFKVGMLANHTYTH